MAVEDKYVNTNQAAGKLGNPAFIQGAGVLAITATFEVAAADDDGSVYRIGNIPSNYIPYQIFINSDAITGGTDYDLGFYKPGVGGAVVDADVLVDGIDLSSGLANGSEGNGLSAVGIDALYKTVYELLAKTVKTKTEGYDLAFTANTVGTAAGTITVRALFIQG